MILCPLPLAGLECVSQHYGVGGSTPWQQCLLNIVRWWLSIHVIPKTLCSKDYKATLATGTHLYILDTLRLLSVSSFRYWGSEFFSQPGYDFMKFATKIFISRIKNSISIELWWLLLRCLNGWVRLKIKINLKIKMKIYQGEIVETGERYQEGHEGLDEPAVRKLF